MATDGRPHDSALTYDALIVGGGPAGLSAALALGRARRRVLLCDAGPRRNSAAAHVYNFVTRDGTPPGEFRHIGQAQLAPYPSVELRELGVEEIRGGPGAFDVRLAAGPAGPSTAVRARRILLCTGMIDELPELDGFRALWGRSIFQCPYCHGWEVQGRRFGVLASRVELLELAWLLRAWTGDVVVLTDGGVAVPPELRASFGKAGIVIDERRITRLVARDQQLEQLEFEGGAPLPLDVLFARPPQRQVPVVQALGLELDPMGYVQVDEAHRETSRPGIYAGGDLVTPIQGAILAAASGMRAAAMLNHALMVELTTGALA
jgi:thioredoxin reductase